VRHPASSTFTKIHLVVQRLLLVRSGGGESHGLLSVSLLLDTTEVRGGTLEVGVDGAGEDVLINIIQVVDVLLVRAGSHGSLPLGAVLPDLVLVVKGSIVVLALAGPALPDRQVLAVNSGAVVLGLAALADELPAALLLAEVKAGGIGKAEPGNDGTGKTEPGHNEELLLGGGVGADDGNDEGTDLTAGSGDTVSSTTDGGGEALGSDKEGNAVGTELVEERGEEVYGLERVDVGGLLVVLELEGGDDEENEAHHETDDLHPLAAIQLVVDEPAGTVVTGKLTSDVDQGPEPVSHNTLRVRADDSNELALEELVTVKEDIVGEPTAGGGKKTRREVLENESERLLIVSSDRGLLLLGLELLRGSAHVVGTVVDEPEGADGRDSEGDTVSPLSGDSGVRGFPEPWWKIRSRRMRITWLAN
jgi:hypothetical protein